MISDELIEIGDFLEKPGNQETQGIGHDDPDDCIDKGNPVQVFQKQTGVNDMSQISCNFLKQHDAKGHASKENTDSRNSFGYLVLVEPPAAGTIDESRIKEKKTVIKTF